MILKLLSLGGLATVILAFGYFALVVLAAIVVVWLLLQGEAAILGD